MPTRDLWVERIAFNNGTIYASVSELLAYITGIDPSGEVCLLRVEPLINAIAPLAAPINASEPSINAHINGSGFFGNVYFDEIAPFAERMNESESLRGIVSIIDAPVPSIDTTISIESLIIERINLVGDGHSYEGPAA